jgi:hypothetical protein
MSPAMTSLASHRAKTEGFPPIKSLVRIPVQTRNACRIYLLGERSLARSMTETGG